MAVSSLVTRSIRINCGGPVTDPGKEMAPQQMEYGFFSFADNLLFGTMRICIYLYCNTV